MSKIDPFIQQIILTAASIACIALGQLVLPGAKDFLMMAAGTLFGKAWLSKPGDVKGEVAP